MNLDPCVTPRYPTYIELLQRALTLWYHDPTVTTPVLKLIAELVLNRSQVGISGKWQPAYLVVYTEICLCQG